MAQTSRKIRKIRRIKRERTLAFRTAAFLLKQRDEARTIAAALETELKKYTDDPFPEGPTEDPVQDNRVTITKVDETPEETTPLG